MIDDVPIFELRGAGYQQDDALILQDIHWSLTPGQHWAVLGPNGSGKTTLLRVACGYQWHTSGTVLRQGRELIDLAEFRSRTGWVASTLFSQLRPAEKAVETVTSGRIGQLGLRGVGQRRPTAGDFEAARALMRAMGCQGLEEKPLGVLSQGERQQVLVARARMADPWLLVLDEPCAGMDPGARERFLAWLRSLIASPQTPAVLLVTHHVEEITPGFENTLVMAEGRVAAAGPTADVLTPELLGRVYATPIKRIERSGGRLWPIWG
ncbi:putative ABC transporter ATP-binding protein YlmA [Pirellulimonas nuda]|uniref:Putative ABC transporter ATP-binding protein YlmA n=1 Tax=Pirellulimonas nuda TaxID=2528009 RepID=A0A518D893_9BACT|nr:ATP-binding cassette domain-containing protein [Pirellulimonas nuda]QDU87697.1 putative ABC transporter ATP-binding protein YlmA [Pirellulimonas nuda]